MFFSAPQDFLNHMCLTPDCNGRITNITIFDEADKIKQDYSRDRNVPAPSTKAKKMKNKKKKPVQQINKKNQNKSDAPSKDITANIEDEADCIEKDNIADNYTPSSENKIRMPECSLPIEGLDLDNVKILKPGTFEDPTPANRKTKPKNKKQRVHGVKTLSLDAQNHTTSEDNEYIAKLSRLNEEKSAVVMTDDDASKVNKVSNKETLILNCNKPFYLPQLLHDKPEAVNKLFSMKRYDPATDYMLMRYPLGNISREAIKTMVAFMRDYLTVQGPTNINSGEFKKHMHDSFPVSGLKHIEACLGIGSFLLRNIDFAMIDDVVCVKEDVLENEDMVLNTISDNFNATDKFNLSDNIAVSHAINQNLSRRSSSSSILSSSSTTATVNSAVATVNSDNEQNTSLAFSNSMNNTVLTSNSVSLQEPVINTNVSSSSNMDSSMVAVPRLASTPVKSESNTDTDEADISTNHLFDGKVNTRVESSKEIALRQKLEDKINQMEMLQQQVDKLQRQISQHQLLQDKFNKYKTTTNFEVTTLKKQLHDSEETVKVL